MLYQNSHFFLSLFLTLFLFHTRTHTHIYTLSHSHKHKHIHTLSHTHSLSLLSHTRTHTHSLFLSCTLSHTHTRIRVLAVVVFSAASYITVALAGSVPLMLFGVVLASISSGFGELTFLCLTTHYDRSARGVSQHLRGSSGSTSSQCVLKDTLL